MFHSIKQGEEYLEMSCKKFVTSISRFLSPTILKNVILITLVYALLGFNFILGGLFMTQTDKELSYSFIALGVVMLIMVPISIIDKRKEMRSNAYVIGCMFVYLFCCCMLCLIVPLWLIPIYIGEIFILTAIFYICKKHKKQSKIGNKGHKGAVLPSLPHKNNNH